MAHCWEAGWACWCNRARKEAGEQIQVSDGGEMCTVKGARQKNNGEDEKELKGHRTKVNDGQKDKREAMGTFGK